MAHAALVLVALALVGSAGAAGFAIHAMDASPGAHLVTVTGEVIATNWNPHFNESVGVDVKNATATIHVELAPPWYWAQQHYPAIKVNDSVSVKGVFDDNRTDSLQAWSISVNGGAWITLRTGDMPAWAQETSGQSPELDHDNESSGH